MFKMTDRLAIYGFKGSLAEFHNVIISIWRESFAICDGESDRFINVEQMLFEPVRSLQFCTLVRDSLDVDVPDGEILHALSNLRKRKKL